ncbi:MULTISPECIES: alpha/beta fold hydrolase [Actinomycetes]|uniref:alpha/beta fold hydrolase n=1 Tax=Actinomycetes TaxID=1760 RepID=UPI0018CC197A|nr:MULTISPECIES: alpha/beta fold hydrolase [Actinomycetes]
MRNVLQSVRNQVLSRVDKVIEPYPVRDLPDGHMVHLPGRGSTFVTDSGPKDAPAIFLLHSVLTTGLLCWYPLIPQLNQEFRVITLDQRWHGRGIRNKPFDLDDCADDVAALADVLGINTFTVAGFSMGGGIAQLVWRRHPDRVTSMVLCSTGPFFGSHDPQRQTNMSNIGRLMKVIHPPHVQPQAAKLDDRSVPDTVWALRQFLSTPVSRLGTLGDGMSYFDSQQWLGEIDVPTAVLLSLKDRVIPLWRQQLLTDNIPGVLTVEVNGGHACCVLEADEFIPKFLDAARRVTAHVKETAPV